MESLASNIARQVLTQLATHTYEEICLIWGVDVELNKLKGTLETITIVLVDAEEKQEKDPRINHWLGKLKDVCYDADNVLDNFVFQKLRMQVLNRGSIKGKVRNLFSCRNPLFFRIKMGHRIKEVRVRLGEIANEKNEFALVERTGGSHEVVHMSKETGSSVEASVVIGRDDDKKEIINLLLKKNGQNVCVISIVGLGGLGKTTLAKLAYNDAKVVETFKLKMWVCVSNNFDKKRLICDIIKSATGEKCSDDSLDQMEIKLQNVLRNKKFLLVLDDVWDKEQMGVTISKWRELKTLLNVGDDGSKIIVTTRSDSVASLMGSMRVHQLQGLPHEDCMTLFIKIAFRKGEEESYPQLMKIAEEIVKKCGGVPLALTTVGGLLYMKRELKDWLHVRDNDIWTLDQGDDDILPALKLSYDALPPHLKLCFAYCSLFPKDYEFHSLALIPMWMAQGFLQSSKGNQGFWEIGHDYIRQLCSRYFFEKIEEDPLLNMDLKMHDLVHDLAISVGKVECSSMNFRPSDTSERVRHVSLTSDEFENSGQLPTSVLELHNVRSVLITESIKMNMQSFVEGCISRFKYLRVLRLESVHVLPSSIGNLSHLRYLNLSGSGIESLPNSICKLHNLQTLLLKCDDLKELPKDIGNLISLVFLVITTKQMYLPEGIRGLTSLQALWVVDCHNLISLGEGFQFLTNLRMLVLGGCENLESFSVNMNQLTKLDTLLIAGYDKLDLMKSGQGIQNLRSFRLVGSASEALPPWLNDCASTLQFIHVEGCDNLAVLPEWLQNLTLLERLVIKWCFKLSAMPEGMHQLTALRELEITGCPELSERCARGGEDWSKIAHVTKITLDGQDAKGEKDAESD